MTNRDVNIRAKKYVEDQLRRYGSGPVTLGTARGSRKTYLYATNPEGSRTVEIYVKAKRKGSWHTTINEAIPTSSELNMDNVTKYWVFVDLGSPLRFWVVPDPWMRNDIFEAHKEYLSKHGGHRAENDDSNHHSIDESRIEQWQDKWEILGIF